MKIREICVGHNPNASNVTANRFDGELRNIMLNGLDVYGGRAHKSKVEVIHPPGAPDLTVTTKIWVDIKSELNVSAVGGAYALLCWALLSEYT